MSSQREQPRESRESVAITQRELGRRLRAAREACRQTQDDVARHLGVSRSTVAQIELGNRGVTGLELGKLAYFFGRDLREFLQEQFSEEDALVPLFRRHPQISSEAVVVEALRACLALGRELTSLERLLGIDRDLGTVAHYQLVPPKMKWEAVQQGERVADEERRRLGLGWAALPSMTQLLESSGIRTAQVALPDDISGLTLIESGVGLFVVVNREHHVLRRRFSFAHEYCHVLTDRAQQGTVSRGTDRENLIEVRANAFAAAFLMPAAGVRQFILGLGKGRPSRLQTEVFDESEPLPVDARLRPGSQDIQLYDGVLLASHFGVSRLAALFRLRNLRLLTAEQFDGLRAREEGGAGLELARTLDLPEPDHQAARNEFRHRFLGLALEAYRRGEISEAKLFELAARVGVSRSEVEMTLEGLGIGDGGEVDAEIPER